MSAAFPLRRPHPKQPQIRFIHQRCTLQSVIRTFIAEFVVGQATQFFINGWQQGIEGVAVAALPALQKLRNLICRVLPHSQAPRRSGCEQG